MISDTNFLGTGLPCKNEHQTIMNTITDCSCYLKTTDHAYHLHDPVMLSYPLQ